MRKLDAVQDFLVLYMAILITKFLSSVLFSVANHIKSAGQMVAYSIGYESLLRVLILFFCSFILYKLISLKTKRPFFLKHMAFYMLLSSVVNALNGLIGSLSMPMVFKGTNFRESLTAWLQIGPVSISVMVISFIFYKFFKTRTPINGLTIKYGIFFTINILILSTLSLLLSVSSLFETTNLLWFVHSSVLPMIGAWFVIVMIVINGPKEILDKTEVILFTLVTLIYASCYKLYLMSMDVFNEINSIQFTPSDSVVRKILSNNKTLFFLLIGIVFLTPAIMSILTSEDSIKEESEVLRHDNHS